VTIYTRPVSSCRKKKRGRRRKNYTHGEWAGRTRRMGDIDGERERERERERVPPTITLPSSDSFQHSQPGLYL